MSDLDKAYIKDDNLMARHIAGETLIVPIRNRIGDLNSIYTLNEVSARIWQMIDGRTRVQQIAEAISDEYDVTADEAACDVIEVLGSMQAEGLIRLAKEGEA